MGGYNMLTVANVHFSYEKTPILKGVSTSLATHEIIGLVGPNGSGKTTLIRAITNILEPSFGEIKINHKLNTLPQVQKEVMYLSSDDVLPEFLTGQEYLLLLLSLYKKNNNELLLSKLLNYYSMDHLFYKLIESYSHGTKKKLQLICAFIIQPNLLIIDETLNGIDIEAREITKRLLTKLLEKHTAIFLCTHDFSLVEELKSRAILIHNGEIYYDSNEYLNNHQNLREIFYDMIKTGDIDYDLD